MFFSKIRANSEKKFVSLHQYSKTIISRMWIITLRNIAIRDLWHRVE